MLVAAFFVLYQQLENYLIAPRIMRRPVQLGPGAVLRARDAADADAATPGDGQTTPPPSQPSMAPPDASKPAARH